jgi:hypothetical protein
MASVIPLLGLAILLSPPGWAATVASYPPAFDSKATGIPNGWNFGLPVVYQLVTGNFNGDGKSDYLEVGGTGYYTFLSNGDGTFNISLTNFGNGWDFGYPSRYQLVTGDFNGDGKTDFIEMGGTAYYTFLSKGNGTFTGTGHSIPNGWNFGFPNPKFQAIDGDFDGDGRSDFALLGYSTYFSFLSSGPIPDSLSTINPGFNRSYDFSYLPLTANSVYAKGIGMGATYQGWWFANKTYYPGDFDGDGRTDFSFVSDTRVYMIRSIAALDLSAGRVTT